MAQIDIIVVSYNTAEYTKRAIESVFKETNENEFKIIMVDNDSKDNSVELIKNNFPDVEIIQTGDNLGFAKAVNIGVKASNSEYILLLNPDTVILESAIDKLVKFAQEKPSSGAWGGITLNNDLSLNPNNARAMISTKTLIFSALGLSKLFNKSCLFNHDNYGCWDRTSERDVDVITGCFLLTTRVLWEKLKGLDETFFMYAEEADYCYRAIQLGYQPRVTPNAKIIHHGGVSETNISGKMLKLLKGKAELINKHSSNLQKPLQKGLLLLHVFNKYITLKIISFFKKEKQQISNEWQQVYQQRNEWMRGYR